MVCHLILLQDWTWGTRGQRHEQLDMLVGGGGGGMLTAALRAAGGAAGARSAAGAATRDVVVAEGHGGCCQVGPVRDLVHRARSAGQQLPLRRLQQPHHAFKIGANHVPATSFRNRTAYDNLLRDN